jgi:hypothetical protein
VSADVFEYGPFSQWLVDQEFQLGEASVHVLVECDTASVGQPTLNGCARWATGAQRMVGQLIRDALQRGVPAALKREIGSAEDRMERR